MKNQESNHIAVFGNRGELQYSVSSIINSFMANQIQIHLVSDSEFFARISKNISDTSSELLQQLPSSEVYGTNNKFDAEKSKHNLQEVIESHNDEPYVIIGTLQSLDNYKDDMKCILQYESDVNNLLKSEANSTFCIYNTDDLSQKHISDLKKHHPYYISGDNLSINGLNELKTSKNDEDYITICMYCKKEKKSKTTWEYGKGSILPFDQIDISHGLCSDCIPQIEL